MPMKTLITASIHIFLIMFSLAVMTGTASAQEAPRFAFPAACHLGGNCWAVNYFDTDPTSKAADFRCGTQTYDGHDGTDFAVRDTKAMEQGVSVLAGADGTVLRVRDGVLDHKPTRDELATVLAANKGCGNGVVIDHGNDWQSIYCHMKRGSIAVKPGQKVQSREVIGLVGQSGAAEFPHLHFGVTRAGKKVDPFTGFESGTACGTPNSQQLWQPSIAYAPFSLYAAGFTPSAADFGQIQKDAGTPATMRRADLKALSFWMVYFGPARGDRIHIEVTGPDGRLFAEQDIVQEKNRARQFYFIGKKAEGKDLPPGVYIGKATLVRDGQDALTGEISKAVMLE